jgi:hypothetical protein
MSKTRTFAGVLALLAAPMLLLSLYGELAPRTRRELPNGFRNPTIALELARTPADVQTIVRDEAYRHYLRKGIDFDFLVIGFYSVFYLALALALVERPWAPGLWLGAVAAVCIASAALFDVLENLRLYQVLDLAGGSPELPARLQDLASATRWKWHQLFLGILLLSVNFFTRERRWHAVVGVLFLVTGAIGIHGAAHATTSIETGFLLMLAGIVAVAVAWFPLRRTKA